MRINNSSTRLKTRPTSNDVKHWEKPESVFDFIKTKVTTKLNYCCTTWNIEWTYWNRSICIEYIHSTSDDNCRLWRYGMRLRKVHFVRQPPFWDHNHHTTVDIRTSDIGNWCSQDFNGFNKILSEMKFQHHQRSTNAKKQKKSSIKT